MKGGGRLAKFSAYSHSDRLRVQTVHGAVVTICGIIVALTLFASEFKHCMTTVQQQEMRVDIQRHERLHFEFNITLPGLPCDAVVLDTGDASGQWKSDAAMQRAKNGEVHKYQLDAEGRRMHLAEWHPSATEFDPFVLRLSGSDMEAIKKGLQQHEGCNMFGWMELARVAGMVHVSVRPEAMLLTSQDPSLSAALVMRHLQLGLGARVDSSKLNMSHVIHTLRFGTPYPGQVNPLDGAARIDRKATGIDKYFIKVIPTEYRTLWGRQQQTQQYSVTEYYQKLMPGEQQPPALFFVYDLSPIMVIVRETRPGLLHLLVRVCAVVGGAFALTGMWDKVIHRLAVALSKSSKASAAA